MNYKNFNNYEIFDASAVVDWDWWFITMLDDNCNYLIRDE